MRAFLLLASYIQHAARVRPFVWLRHRIVIVFDKLQDAISQVVPRAERAATDHTPAQHAEPDLDLIHPRRMFRYEYEMDPVRGIRQELFPRRDRFQHAAFPFYAQRIRGDAAHRRDQEYQRGGDVRRQVVRHEDPAVLGIGRDGLLDVYREVGLGSRLLHGRGDHFSRRDLEVADERLRAVPNVFGLAFLALSGPQRFGRSGRFERLNAGLLIDAHCMDSLILQPVRCRSIGRTHHAHLLLEGRRVFRIGVEPVTTFVRLKFRRLLKNVRPVGRKSLSQCLV
jgi:hypothetical protein